MLEVVWFCYSQCVWLVSGAIIPSFRREVNNLRKWFVTAQLFCQASSQSNLFLGADFAQMGCNQNAGSSYGCVNSEEPAGYVDMDLEQVIGPLLVLVFVPLLSGITCLRICGDKTSDAYLGGTRIECILFTQSPLCRPKIRARFPPSSFSSEFHTAQIQGCILLGQGNFFLVSRVTLTKTAEQSRALTGVAYFPKTVY